MKSKKVLITSPEWFEHGSLNNPIQTFDHAMEAHFPEFYCIEYDTKLLAANPPTREEKEFWAYNDYLERYGTRALGHVAESLSESNFLLLHHEAGEYRISAPLPRRICSSGQRGLQRQQAPRPV